LRAAVADGSSVAAARPRATRREDLLTIEGYAAILLTTIILLGPALWLIRRWTVPFGTFAFVFGAVGALSASIETFDIGPSCLAPLLGGLVADVLYRRIRPRPERPWAVRAWAGAVPVAIWLAYFALLATFRSVGWSVELWAGATVMSGLVGFGLAVLATPPPLPTEVAPPVE
jgi:hypothetical protein